MSFLLLSTNQSSHQGHVISFCISSLISSKIILLVVRQAGYMSFGTSLYNGLPLVHWALLRLACWVAVLSQGHMFFPKLTVKGLVLLRNGRCFLCCNVWSPVFWMICTFGLLLTMHRMISVLCCLMVVSDADSLLYMMYTLRSSTILSGSWLVLRSGMNARVTPQRGRAAWTYLFEVPTTTYEYVNDEFFFLIQCLILHFYV